MSSHHEIEARWLNLDPAEMRKRLAKAGAKKTGDYFFTEWIFCKPEWKKTNKRIRVRTDGKKHWLTLKVNETFTVDSTHEIELEVSDPEKMVELLKTADIPQSRIMEKKRERYELGNITFDMDFWPKIPMVLEIEAPSEAEVRKGAELLGLKWEDAVFVDQAYVHRDYYGIDIFNISDYRFEK